MTFARDLRRLRENAGGPTYRELSGRAHYSAAALSEAANGRKLPSLAVTLAYVVACGGDRAEWESRWRSAAAEVAGARGTDHPARDEPVPYVGLAAFEVADADRFFGRDDLIATLVRRVREHRFLGVFGASGSGKSSVLRAGLVARLDRRDIVVFTPGAHPIEECAIRLASRLSTSPAVLRAEFAADPKNLHLRIRQAMADRPGDLIVVVDQFEEVFTLADQAERTWLIRALIRAAVAPTSRARVVLGIRADFYGHCGLYPELVEAIHGAQVLVAAMTADQLRQVITQPAERAGYRVETALVSRLISDATDQPGVLPLLSHALLETWRRRRGTTLTLAAYDAVGGIHHALAHTAESVYTNLAPRLRDIARQVLLRLIAVTEDNEATKRRIRRTELDEDDPHTDVVLETLAQARLITLDHDRVDLAHEALIRHWPRLRGWFDDSRDDLRTHRQLTDATDIWQALDHDAGALYRGTRLSTAHRWAARNSELLTPREWEFLHTSQARQAGEEAATRRRTRRLRQLVGLLLVLVLAISVVTVVAVGAQRTATAQRDLAVASKVLGDADTLRTANPALALQLTLAAYRLHPSREARDALYTMFATPYAVRLTGAARAVWGVAVSPDGRTLAVATLDQTTRLWDITDPIRPRALPGLPSSASSVTFSPDGHLLVTADPFGATKLWDVTDPRHAHQLATLAGDRSVSFTAHGIAADFDPTGKVLVTAHRDGTARLWDLTDPAQPRALARVSVGPETDRDGTAVTVAFGADGRCLISVGADATLRMWDLSDLRAPRPLPGLPDGAGSRVSTEAVSPNGHILATAYDSMIQLWNLTDPAHPEPLAEITTTTTYAVAFGPDGNTLATSGGNGTTHLWNIADPRHPTASLTLTGHTNDVHTVAFSPDGHTLITGGRDAAARLTDISQQALSDASSDIAAVEFSADGKTLATTTLDGRTHLRDVTDPRHPTHIADIPITAAPMAQSLDLDRRLLATVDTSHTPRIWDISAAHPLEIATLPTRATTIAFSPTNNLVVTADVQGATRLWDLTDPHHPTGLADLPPGSTFPLFAVSVAFSPAVRVKIFEAGWSGIY